MNNIDQLLNDLEYFTKNRRFKDCLAVLDELQDAMNAEEASTNAEDE